MISHDDGAQSTPHVLRTTEPLRNTAIARWLIGSFVGAVLLAACGADAGESRSPAADEGPASTSTSSTSALSDGPATMAFPVGPSALDSLDAEGFPAPLIDPREIISGGPPPDGIPPIDDPTFLSVAENLEYLPAAEPVVSLEIDGDARAYPIRAMVWHEIVNDTVGGVPVTVTYCPLCNSAATYDRRIDGAVTTFGTSGRLFASALVMYDRATESLWTHFDGRAVVGVLAGAQLEEYASPLLSWGDFRSEYPNGRVLDFEAAGFDRDYGRNPYVGYDDEDATPFLFRGALDDRASAMQRVVGIEVDGVSRAFALEGVRGGSGRATSSSVGERAVVIFWKPGQSSALEGGSVSDGRDIGSVAVFDPVVDGRELTFAFRDGAYVDDQTDSTWSIAGRSIEGALAGTVLNRVPHLDTFWFAWSTYQPDTDLVGS
jgi:hypothetical protein